MSGAEGSGGSGTGRGSIGRGILFKQAILQHQQARSQAAAEQEAGGSHAAAGISSPLAQPSTSVSSAPPPTQPMGRGALLMQMSAALKAKGRGISITSQEPTASTSSTSQPPTISAGTTGAVPRGVGRAMLLLHGIQASKSAPGPERLAPPEPSREQPPAEPAPVPVSAPAPPPTNITGTAGTRIDLTANYIPIKLRPGCHLYEYAVLYDPEVDSRNFRFKLVGQQSEVLGIVRVFDGSKLYIPRLLPEKITQLRGEHPGDGSEVTVTVKFVAERDFKDCNHLFNVLFKRVMKSLSLTEVGRHSYDPKSAIPVPQHKLEIWPGFITAINEYKGGLMLQADVSHRVLRRQTVLDLMVDLKRTSGPNFCDAASKKLIGVVVLTRYNNATYRIDEIAFNMTPRSTFKTARGEEISFIQYYKTHYNITIRDENQPLLVNHAKPRRRNNEPIDKNAEPQLLCLIPELSFLTGLTDDLRSDYQVMKDLAAHTRVNPTERQHSLRTFIRNVNSNTEARTILDSWGLFFEEDTLRLPGRVMRTEKIIMKNNTFMVNEKADWTRDATSSHVLNSMDLEHWEVVFCHKDEGKADEFIKLMGSVSPSLGMIVRRPNKTKLRDDRTDTLIACLKDILTRKQIQLITIINPTMRTDRYSAIKKLCCCDIPVPTQVINSKTLNKPNRNRSIVMKIALQINCKLGGELWGLDIPLKSLMVCGFDAYHDPAKGNMSVLGFVASINVAITRWFNHTCVQTKGQEIGDSLCLCLSRALRKYYEVNHTLPEKIVVYRDGVGDGQMRTVSEYEVPQFEKAFAAYQNYNPMLTVIVVQKRINTRLMAIVPGRDGRFENPPTGTVVDHTITKKAWYDFYLVSQFANQGTVFPTHYTVVHNNSNLAPDHVQRLSYKMTHLYYNWPGTIRVPAVCQYAHRLAYLVGQNIRQVPNDQLSDRLFFL